jgi:hypothetical protein
MRRHPGLRENSLELLLDTICNTFGGVLFLAMLTSLMLSQTQPDAADAPVDPKPAVSPAEFVRLDTRLKSAALEVSRLQAQVHRTESVAADLAVPGADDLLKEKESVDRAAEQLRSRRATLLSEVASDQAATARAVATVASERRNRQRVDEISDRAESRLTTALAAREALLASAIALRDKAIQESTITTTGRAPRMRSTNKNEFSLMIKYGRLYVLETLQNGRFVLNQEDFSLRPGLFMNIAEARPYAGIDLGSPETREAGLQKVMRGVSPSKWYALLIVRSDSFEEYVPVKNWLVEQGFEYRIIPGDSPISEGGTNVSVQ